MGSKSLDPEAVKYFEDAAKGLKKMVYETGGHGEPREIVVECKTKKCKHWISEGYHPEGKCYRPRFVEIDDQGRCKAKVLREEQ